VSHTNAWSESVPAQSDPTRYGALRIRTLKLDVRERLALEHIFGVGTTTDGQHKPGLCGICYVGTTAEIAALSSPPGGAIAFDTDLGVFKYYDSAVWSSVSVTGFTGNPASMLLTDTGLVSPQGRFRIYCDDNIVSIDAYQDSLTWGSIFQFSRDGSVGASGALNMGGFKVTDVANATTTGDALNYAHKSAATLDHPDSSVTYAKLAADAKRAFGAYAAKVNDTVYQAASDGFVVAYTGTLSWSNALILVGDSNPPTMAAAYVAIAGADAQFSMMTPVASGQYWKTTSCAVVRWVPVGV
jgi:hypothetical protein